MMKSEKLWDFKTQEQKIQAVWNVGIRNIGITRAASQPSAKEKKTLNVSGVFDFCEIASKLQHSIGKDCVNPPFQTLTSTSFPLFSGS